MSNQLQCGFNIPALTLAEKDTIYDQANELINLLDDECVKEMLEVTDNDYDLLLEILAEETNNVVNLKQYNSSLTTTALAGLSNLQEGYEIYLRRKNLPYFIHTCLPDFMLSYHCMEWCSMIQMYKNLCVIAARGHSKSFTFSFANIIWRLFRYVRPNGIIEPPAEIKFYKEGMMITNEFKLAKKLLRKVKEEIRANPELNKYLYPSSGDLGTWANESIICKNGSEVTLSSFRTSNRGPHPGWIDVDDFLDKSAMYSKEQREKFKEVFHAEIMNMILPQGQVTVVGTPFHERDLYYELKQDPNWHVFEYPAVFPDGSVLDPVRFSFESLKAKRISLGPLIFSREILVRPISDSTSIFPWSLLEKSFVGTKNVWLVDNRASFPIPLRKVCIGVDWALSANVSADYTIFTVTGEDDYGNIWLLNMIELHGAGYNQQIATLQALNTSFAADVVVAETNGFQEVMAGLAKEAGMTNIVEEVTGNNKKDLYEGLPALAVLFDQGKIKFPRGDERSIERTNQICSELASIAFDEDKGTLESVSEHDDKAMSLYFSIKGLRSINGVFRVTTTT